MWIFGNDPAQPNFIFNAGANGLIVFSRIETVGRPITTTVEAIPLRQHPAQVGSDPSKRWSPTGERSPGDKIHVISGGPMGGCM
jgi:hypothetical protein